MLVDGIISMEYLKLLVKMMDKISLCQETQLNEIHFIDADLGCNDNELELFKQEGETQQKWDMLVKERHLHFVKNLKIN